MKLINGVNKLTEVNEENEKQLIERLNAVDPDIMAYLLNQEDITYEEEKNQYLDKDGNVIELATLMQHYDEAMARALEIEGLKQERARSVFSKARSSVSQVSQTDRRSVVSRRSKMSKASSRASKMT